VLLAAPGSRSAAYVHSPLESQHPDRIGSALYESNHVGVAYDTVNDAASEGRAFDVVHDHSGFTAVAMAPRSPAPVVHTLHAPFDEDTTPFYSRHGHHVTLVAISRYQQEHAPPGVRITEMVPNRIRVADWPFCEHKDAYLLRVGRLPLPGEALRRWAQLGEIPDDRGVSLIANAALPASSRVRRACMTLVSARACERGRSVAARSSLHIAGPPGKHSKPARRDTSRREDESATRIARDGRSPISKRRGSDGRSPRVLALTGEDSTGARRARALSLQHRHSILVWG
jgi:hypothetical protein